MRYVAALVCVCCLAAPVLVSTQEERERGIPKNADTPTVTPGIPGVVAAGTKIQFLQSWGMEDGGEGPIPMPDGSVLFTLDDPFRIGRMDRDGKFSTYLQTQPRRILALGYDFRTKRLLGTQRFPGALSVVSPTGLSTLHDKYQGKPLQGPNDLVIDLKGGVYFTDPGDSSAVYYVNPAGQLILATSAHKRPNGVQLSPDEKVAYVCGTAFETVTAFDVQADGRLTNPRDFARVAAKAGEEGGADGMAMDSEGRLYVGASAGVMVFSPKGQLLGTISLPLKPRNLSFFGPDRKSLFVVSRGAAYRIAMLSQPPKGRAK